MNNTPETEPPDEVLQEVWRIKDELAAAHGYDVHRMCEEARRLQAESGRRILSPPQRRDALPTG